MASAAMGASRKPIPRWARRRFVQKHSGLSHGMMIALPASAALWVAVAVAVGII